jgi:hypothetical protein
MATTVVVLGILHVYKNQNAGVTSTGVDALMLFLFVINEIIFCA